MDPIGSIVVATDFSPHSRAATERACLLAERFEAPLHLIHSARLPIPGARHEFAVPGPEWDTLLDAAHKEIDALAARVEQRGLRVTRAVSRAPVVEAILGAAVERKADLIVVGSHGHTGLRRAVLGSIAERTLRSASVPVLVVKEDEARAAQPIQRILLATDFSRHAVAAAGFATDLARVLDAVVHICHVHAASSPAWMSLDPPPPADWVRALQDRARDEVRAVLEPFQEAGLQAETHLIADTPSEAIPTLAEELEVDLIVMGTRGRSGLRHVMLGSVAERTARLAPCSVLAHPLWVERDGD